MNITHQAVSSPWLLLIFSMPAKRSSERVGVWRKLQKHGSLSLRNSGYILPNSPLNLERFEWLAAMIRGFQGEASVLHVSAVDDLPDDVLREKFREERKGDYLELVREVKALKRSNQAFSQQLTRLKRRFEEIVEIDFYHSSLRDKAMAAIQRAERQETQTVRSRTVRLSKADFQKRIWITRPQPGIDRVSSAWLIRRFIDPKALFRFHGDARTEPEGIPFDMYQAGDFGHEGDHCTFETLCHRFGIRDRKVVLMGKVIHDADLEDEKFGRSEGIVLHQILTGWSQAGVEDEALMERGIQMIEGLYHSIS